MFFDEETSAPTGDDPVAAPADPAAAPTETPEATGEGEA